MPINNIGIGIKEQVEIHKHFDNLFNDEKVDFSDRLDNLWKSQVETAEKYGRDGLAVLLDYKMRMYAGEDVKKSMEIMHYTQMPEACPWYDLRTLPLGEAIRKAWEAYPIDFAVALEENCKDLFAMISEGKWFLAYAYEAVDYRDVNSIDFLAGRAPEPDATLPGALIEAGWKMPEDLKAFYSVHGNFGDITAAIRNDDTHCISSAEKLEASLTFLEEYVEKWDVDYSFFDLLPFCEDGAGNSQNFYKAMKTDDSYMTVDWDHETKEISGGSSLADFIDFQFGEKFGN